jgi:hypothetical protein
MNEISNRNPKLRILSLNNNLIGDNGCGAISKALVKLKGLEILYLSNIHHLSNKSYLENNNIQDKGGIKLCEGILENTSLQLINLCIFNISNIFRWKSFRTSKWRAYSRSYYCKMGLIQVH